MTDKEMLATLTQAIESNDKAQIKEIVKGLKLYSVYLRFCLFFQSGEKRTNTKEQLKAIDEIIKIACDK